MFSPDYSPALYVVDGCGGVELGCNHGYGSQEVEVQVVLAAGQAVIVVDGGHLSDGGPFDLQVQ